MVSKICKNCAFCTEETPDGYAVCQVIDRRVVKVDDPGCNFYKLPCDEDNYYEDAFGNLFKYYSTDNTFHGITNPDQILNGCYRVKLTHVDSNNAKLVNINSSFNGNSNR